MRRKETKWDGAKPKKGWIFFNGSQCYGVKEVQFEWRRFFKLAKKSSCKALVDHTLPQ